MRRVVHDVYACISCFVLLVVDQLIFGNAKVVSAPGGRAFTVKVCVILNEDIYRIQAGLAC